MEDEETLDEFMRLFLNPSLSPDTATTGWAFLKEEMKSPSTNNVKEFVADLDQLKAWQVKAPAAIPPTSMSW